MRTVAIVGAGFAGLAAAYFLSEHCAVTLFDSRGIGGGASGISSGLLHPYPGEKGRGSMHATKAMSLSKKLLREAEEALQTAVCEQNGIIRLHPCLNPGPDVIPLDDGTFLISSGITVFSDLYLKGLWKVCENKGVQLVIQKIESIASLQNYDSVVLAAGAGIRHFSESESLPINYVKGQLLTCSLKQPLERSVAGKIYTAKTQFPLRGHVGATYEHDDLTDTPNLGKAALLLRPTLPVISCAAAVRVTCRTHYFPLALQLNFRLWTITALGSRGLLYHALMGHLLAEKMGYSTVRFL